MLERTILDGRPGLAETKTISTQTGAGAELGNILKNPFRFRREF